jgi:hypothetical protein
LSSTGNPASTHFVFLAHEKRFRILPVLFAPPVLFTFETAALRGRFFASGALPQSFVLVVQLVSYLRV